MSNMLRRNGFGKLVCCALRWPESPEVGSGNDGEIRIFGREASSDGLGDRRIIIGDVIRNGSSSVTTVNLSPSLEGTIVWV